jgi:hypothetical protein
MYICQFSIPYNVVLLACGYVGYCLYPRGQSLNTNFVGIRMCIGLYIGFFGCFLRVFLTLCVECWCLYEGLYGTGAISVCLDVLTC